MMGFYSKVVSMCHIEIIVALIVCFTYFVVLTTEWYLSAQSEIFACTKIRNSLCLFQKKSLVFTKVVQ